MPALSAHVWFFFMGVAGELLRRRSRKRNPTPKERATATAYNLKQKSARSLYYKKRRTEPEWRTNANRKSALDFQRAKVKRITTHKRWLIRNADRNREWHRQNANRLRATIPYYNIRNRLTSRVWTAVARSKGKKAAKTEELIGCTVAQLRDQLESQFTDGMTWEKFLRGEIHIDHKIPCAHFDLADEAQQRACFHWSNLQPLWSKDNLSKGDRISTIPTQ